MRTTAKWSAAKRIIISSQALAVGRNLAVLREAVGHANVSITSAYQHVLVDNEKDVDNLFGNSTQTTMR